MDEIRRTYGLLLKFTEEEKKKLFEMAKEMHLSKASYIRMCVFGNLRAEKGMYQIKKNPNSPKILKEIKKHTLFQKDCITELKNKILNNEFKLNPVPDNELEDIRKRKEEMLLKINNEMNKINKKTIEILKESEAKPLENC